LIGDISAGRIPRKNDQRILEVADAWLQEEKELTLILSRLVNRRCISLSERRLRKGGYDLIDEIAGTLTEWCRLAVGWNLVWRSLRVLQPE